MGTHAGKGKQHIFASSMGPLGETDANRGLLGTVALAKQAAL